MPQNGGSLLSYCGPELALSLAELLHSQCPTIQQLHETESKLSAFCQLATKRALFCKAVTFVLESVIS